MLQALNMADTGTGSQLRGHRVCIVEQRRVEGRAQEWNISRPELAVLQRLGLLTQEQLETAVASEWVRLLGRKARV